jgi:hypothetical protein
MFLLVIALVLALCIGPVKIGASLVGARRKDLAACFAALVIALLAGRFITSHVRLGLPSWHLGGTAIHPSDLLVVLVAGLVYMLVLGTTYPRGLAVALIQYVLTIVLVVALAATLVGPTLRHVMR